MSNRERLDSMRALLDSFLNEIECAEHYHANRGKGGQHVPFHGDFASAVPSVMSRLRWWERAFRDVLTRSCVDDTSVPAPDREAAQAEDARDLKRDLVRAEQPRRKT